LLLYENETNQFQGSLLPPFTNIQPVRLAGSYHCWFVKKYCWLVCVRGKYCSGWKFTIVYNKPHPNEQADYLQADCLQLTNTPNSDPNSLVHMG